MTKVNGSKLLGLAVATVVLGFSVSNAGANGLEGKVQRSAMEAEAEAMAADVNGGIIPLMFAARKGNLHAVQAIVEDGADVNLKDNTDTTPLMLAAYKGNLDVVKYLVEHGADVNAQTTGHWTALDIALDRQKSDVVNYLLPHALVDRMKRLLISKRIHHKAAVSTPALHDIRPISKEMLRKVMTTEAERRSSVLMHTVTPTPALHDIRPISKEMLRKVMPTEAERRSSVLMHTVTPTPAPRD